MRYQIRSRREADCDGGRTFFVVVDTENNENEMSEWFEKESDCEEFCDELNK
jgi:hypothetical protein